MFLKSDKGLKTDWKTTQYELLVPANNKTTALKAIDAGADAVYIGYSKYGARVQAGNSVEDLIEVIEYAHKYRVKVYITVNTILKDEEIKEIESLLWRLYNINADGIIIQDMGILECNLPPIKLIASTQCHNNTVEKIKFLEETGISRVILPREITLDEIKTIRKSVGVELECFIHGALCVSYSGQCYLSYAIGKRSANRGECAQPCRKKYSLIDADGKYIVRNKYILSLKDLNLSQRLEELIESGITSFKIEGRLKNEAYVVNTTAYYREIIDKILQSNNLKRSSEGISYIDFEPDLNKTFNRGYCEFNIDGIKKDWATMNYTSSLGEYIGVVKETKKDYFCLNTNILNNSDGICFFNEEKELIGTNINRTEGYKVYPASIKGIKQGTKIYRNYNKEFDDKLKNTNIIRKIPVKIKVRETKNDYLFFMYDEENNCAIKMVSKRYEPAINKEKAINTLEIQLSKSGNTEFKVISTDIKIQTISFIKVSQINEIRRNLTNKLSEIRKKNYKKERGNKINKVQYPYKEIDYKANVLNEKSKLFYEKRGCEIKEYAPESNSDTKNRELMVSKYCIKNQLGLCPKQSGIKKYKEPYVLKDEFNKEYLVEFNCKDCVMKIRSKI